MYQAAERLYEAFLRKNIKCKLREKGGMSLVEIFADLNIAQAKPVDIPEAPLQPLKDEEVEKQSIIRALQSCMCQRAMANREMIRVKPQY